MNTAMMIIFTAVIVTLQGALFLILPAITRRGLLFGAYVGEKESQSEEARRIKRSWYIGMVSVLVLGLVAGLLLGFNIRPELAPVVAVLIVTIGFFVLYLKAYFEARAMAPAVEAPSAAAPLTVAQPASLVLPVLTIALCVAMGLFAFGFALAHYGELPQRVPIHFGPSGKADSWGAKSFFSVFLLPLLGLVVGSGVAVIAYFISTAKRAIRHPDGGVSLAAQQRFHRVMSRFLCGTALLVSAMLMTGTVSIVQVSMGRSDVLSPVFMVIAVVMLVYAVAGTLVIAFRYGQGGARLEKAGADAPLTNGLADNRHWVLGMFYINKEDPSIMVERRFGLGYTLNFGNWKVAVFFGALMVLILALVILAIFGIKPIH